MFKIILGSLVVATSLLSADLQSSGVEVTLENGKKATIKRKQSCGKRNALPSPVSWGEAVVSAAEAEEEGTWSLGGSRYLEDYSTIHACTWMGFDLVECRRW